MPINLTILGSGSAVPNLNRSVSGQYLNFNERRILIDCGEGTQLQLRKYKVKFQRLQYVFISHLHGDHYLGIFGLIASMNLLGRTNKLIIFAPEGLEEIVRYQFKMTGVYLGFELEFVALNVSEKTLVFEDNSIRAFAFPLKHRITCFGFLFEEKQRDLKVDKRLIGKHELTLEEILKLKRGEDIVRENETLKNGDMTLPPEPLASYAYCSDTAFLPQLADWISGVRLLYHEATFTGKHKKRAKETGHSTAGQAAEIAKMVKAERLLLGHFSARYNETDEILEEAQPIFKNTVCVEDGDVYLV